MVHSFAMAVVVVDIALNHMIILHLLHGDAAVSLMGVGPY